MTTGSAMKSGVFAYLKYALQPYGTLISLAQMDIAVGQVEKNLATARAMIAEAALAMEFGATDGILATRETPWRTLQDKTGRKADAVFVTVGAIPAYDTAPQYLASGGKIVMVGMPASGAMSSYEPDIFASLSQGMIGSKMGNVVLSRDIPWLVDLYRQGRLKLDELVSHRWPLDQINEAIADTRGGHARRNVIVF